MQFFKNRGIAGFSPSVHRPEGDPGIDRVCGPKCHYLRKQDDELSSLQGGRQEEGADIPSHGL